MGLSPASEGVGWGSAMDYHRHGPVLHWLLIYAQVTCKVS